MLNRKKILFSIILFIASLCICNICMAKDLDEIEKYYITVDPRNDGTLDISYHIEWKVLDSDSEGPLTWVKIGIPNLSVDEIKALSSNISDIRYYKNNGDYVRIDFSKSYYENEIVEFDYSIHQSYMYEIDNYKCNYNFIPGWFDNIKVKEYYVFWNANNVLKSNSNETNSDNYLVWTGKLNKGKKVKINVTYYKSNFNLNEYKQASNALVSKRTTEMSETTTNLMIILFIVICIASMFSKGGYRKHGGYGYRDRDRDRNYHSSCASSCACVSSCACACACAGGGRAGCSKKDFYGTNLRTQKLNQVLNDV